MTPIKQLLHSVRSHATLSFFFSFFSFFEREREILAVPLLCQMTLYFGTVRLVLVQHSTVKFPEILHDTD